MTLGKSLLLGSAAAMCAVFGAQAADLPVRKAAPVDYVRVCDFTGAGFFYIPGTDTCMQVGGILRTEFDFINNSRAFFPQAVTGTGTGSTNNTNRLATIPAGTLIPGRDRDETGFFARARLSIDTRTQTAYGQLRAFLQFQADRLQGIYSGGGPNGGANSFANQGGNNVVLRRGFIQFAGITAADLNQDVFAYTYTFGGGLSSTLSFEDRTGRNLPQNLGNILGGPSALVSAARYAGETIPDIVGVLRYDQPWGAAQLSAAYHEIQSTEGPFAGTGNQGIGTADTNGFAVQGGVRIKLPMLAAGDDLWLEGTYQQGAYFYQDSGTFLNGGFSSLAVGGFQHIDRDAIAIHTPGTSAASYSLQKGEGFSALAAFNHYFTPNFHDVLFGSYEQTTYGRAKNIDWTLGGLGDGSEYRVGNQFLWDPVKNLEFGLEFTYMHIDQTLAHNPGQAATSIAGLKGVAQNPDAFEVRLRAERDF